MVSPLNVSRICNVDTMFLATIPSLASETGSMFILALSEYKRYCAGYQEKYIQMKFQLSVTYFNIH